MKENEIEVWENQISDKFEDKYVSLSNALIQAREKTSLLESKIELFAIYKMNDEVMTLDKKDATGREYSVHAVTIQSKEIKELMGRASSSIYTQIEAASNELLNKKYIYRDEVKNEFRMQPLYQGVDYKNGKLTIEFNPDTEFLFTQLADNYTKLRLDIAFKFQTNGGFQLYKLLKSYAYVLPDPDPSLPQEKQKTLVKQFTLSELRLQLGYVDLDQPEVKKEGSKAHPDPEKMTAVEKKPKYKRWTDFYNRVLVPGMTEINRMSDIYVQTIEKVQGSHGKVEEVSFTIQKNAGRIEPEQKLVLTEDEIDDFIDVLRLDHSIPFKTKDLKSISEKANYDLELIISLYSKAVDALAEDKVKWILNALEEDTSDIIDN